MNTLPAIVIGGPPHSGKSVLTYSLTQALRMTEKALRLERVEHFVVRACPDGEGDWNNEAHPERVRLIRAKGAFTPDFVSNICEALQNRHLPLLVDVGGKISAEQRAIVRHCTHAILISSDPLLLADWRTLADEQGLTVIAELHSTLTEDEAIFADGPILSGRIAGLERGTQASGPLFERLVWCVRTLFALPEKEMRQIHLAAAPTDTLDLDRLGPILQSQKGSWLPADLVKVLDYLPAQEPYSLYGRGPNWLYGTLAAHMTPALFYQFDPVLGWIKPVQPIIAADAEPTSLSWSITQESADLVRLSLKIVDNAYLDYDELQTIKLPSLPADKGLILDGKLPHWLITGLVLAYHTHPMIAIFQPQGGVVVVKSTIPSWSVGDIIAA